MGMFDLISVENIVLVKNNSIPILPLQYQTKNLDCRLKKYSLEEALEKFKLRELIIYAVFDQDYFLKLLENDTLKSDILFSINDFSRAADSRWLEYRLKISKRKITNIDLVIYKY